MTTAPALAPSDSLSFPDTPASLRYEEIIKEVTAPLPSHLIEVRPGATTRDKKKAIALAYYDWRIMVNRLNRLVGGRNWYADLHPWGEHKLICTLTILGVPKDSSGEGEADDENGGTSAEQQAKKRAMAEHGLNYLYLLPQVWGDYDAEKKRFVNPQALVEEMYRKARIEGLDLTPSISSAHRVPAGRSSTPVGTTPPTLSPETSLSATASTPGEPKATTEKSALPSPQDKTVQGIRKLCAALGKAEPAYDTLTAQSAQQLLTTLTNEYKAARARSAATSATSR